MSSVRNGDTLNPFMPYSSVQFGASPCIAVHGRHRVQAGRNGLLQINEPRHGIHGANDNHSHRE